MKVNEKKYSKKDLEIIKARLIDGKSFREIETEILKINSPVRGGGFKAKKILDSYGVLTKYKGTITKQNISKKIENSDGIIKTTLIELKNYLLNSVSEQKIQINNKDIKKPFSNEELRDILYLRLFTQNRFYDSIIYPIQYIKQKSVQFGFENTFKSILFDKINSIKFQTTNKTLLFPDIQKLIITKNNEVYIKDNNNVYHKLKTRIGDTANYKDLKATEIRYITIDHIKPQKDLLEELINEFSALSKLFHAAKKINKGKKIKDKDEFNSIINQIEKSLINEKFVIKLLDDIRLIAENSDLEIMSSKENSSKSNKQTN